MIVYRVENSLTVLGLKDFKQVGPYNPGYNVLGDCQDDYNPAEIYNWLITENLFPKRQEIHNYGNMQEFQRSHPNWRMDTIMFDRLCEIAAFKRSGPRMVLSEYIFGFKDLKQTVEWFCPDSRQRLQDRGYYLALYSVPDMKDFVIHGEKQTIFKQSEGKLVGFLCLTEL